MSKFGWDLPPGCSSSDIPGNRPEDLVREAQADEIYTVFPDATDEQIEKMFVIFGKHFGDGYKQVQSDGQYEQLTEQEWRTIHNALAVFQCTERDLERRQRIQQIMDRVRDNHIAKYGETTSNT